MQEYNKLIFNMCPVARLVLETILEAVFKNSNPLPLELPSAVRTPCGPALSTREVSLQGIQPSLGSQLPSKLVLLAPLELRPRCPKHL